MDEGVLLAKSLAMLVQEVRGQADQASLKAFLTQACRYSRATAMQAELRDGQLIVHGTDMSAGGLDALTDAMQRHRVGRLSIDECAPPKELLLLANLLAGTGKAANEPTVFDEAREFSFWCVRLFPMPRGEASPDLAAGARALAEFDREQATVKAADLLQQVAQATDGADSSRTVALLHLLMDTERLAGDEVRHCWTDAFDQAATPETIRLLVLALPDVEHERSVLLDLLRRAGTTGANALVAQLLAADELDLRRICFDAIAELHAGVPLLVDLLRHPQWYVVRNAALLLGEMQAQEAETELARLLSHDDERVRIAVTIALSQIGTARARTALQQGIRDESAEVRRRALRGFSAEQSGTSSAALIHALDTERDHEVQVEIVVAMGRMRSPDAVQKLARLCSPASASQTSSTVRIAAAEALACARGPAALPLLRGMLNDHDAGVRNSARALIDTVSVQGVG